MFKKLAFLEASALRQYRLDQYSLRHKTQRGRTRRRVKVGYPMIATTTLDLYGEKCMRRGTVIPGRAISKIGDDKLGIEPIGMDNHGAAYREDTNLLSVMDHFNDRVDPKKTLPDEIPLEKQFPANEGFF